MNQGKVQVEQAKSWFFQLNETQKKIVMAAAGILLLMILFPPKAITMANPMMGGTISQHYGYVFLFNNPAAQAGGGIVDMSPYIQAQIEWGRLLLQFAVVGAVAFFAIKSQETKGASSTPPTI